MKQHCAVFRVSGWGSRHVRRVFEAIFGHWMRVVLLMLVPLVAGAAVAFTAPRKYQVTASLLAVQAFATIGVNGPITDPYASAAQTQATVLEELLQTRTFNLAVGQQTDIASTFDAATRANPQKLDDAIAADISTNTVVAPGGGYLYTITYTGKSPTVAVQVVSAIIKEFGPAITQVANADGKQLQDFYQQAVRDDTKAWQAAVAAASACVRTSTVPSAAVQDPECVALEGQRDQAAATLQHAKDALNQVESQMALNTGQSGFFTVYDAPQKPIAPQSRAKTIIMYVVGGFVLGLFAAALYILILLRRDRTIVDPRDLERAVGYPVLVELPALPGPSASMLVQRIAAR